MSQVICKARNCRLCLAWKKEANQMTDWLNCKGNLYVTYSSSDLVDAKLVSLIDLYGFAFDDSFWYWRPRARRNHKPLAIVKRSPIWTYPKKSVDVERPKDPFQKKLLEIQK